MADESKLNERDALNASLGQAGRHLVSDTSAEAAPAGYYFHTIKVVIAATFSALVDAGATGTETGIEFPVGYSIHGTITTFTLSGGTVHAYLAKLPS